MLIRGCVALLCCVLASPAWALEPVCGAETTDSDSPGIDPQTLVATPSATGGVWIVHVGLHDADADNTVASGVTSSAGGTFTLYGVNAETSTEDVLSYVFYSTDYVGGSQTLTVQYNAAPQFGFIAQFVCTGTRKPDPWLGAATNTMSWSAGTSEVWGSVGGCLVPAGTRRPSLPIFFQ